MCSNKTPRDIGVKYPKNAVEPLHACAEAVTSQSIIMMKESPMTSPLRLGIAGLGTVGVGVVKIIQQKADLLAMRTGRPITITAVSAKSQAKNRGVDLSN